MSETCTGRNSTHLMTLLQLRFTLRSDKSSRICLSHPLAFKMMKRSLISLRPKLINLTWKKWAKRKLTRSNVKIWQTAFKSLISRSSTLLYCLWRAWKWTCSGAVTREIWKLIEPSSCLNKVKCWSRGSWNLTQRSVLMNNWTKSSRKTCLKRLKVPRQIMTKWWFRILSLVRNK